MGWWRTGSGGVIGDAPADVLEEGERGFGGPDEIPDETLNRIRREYQEAFSRDPSRQELAELIEFCFGTKGG